MDLISSPGRKRTAGRGSHWSWPHRRRRGGRDLAWHRRSSSVEHRVFPCSEVWRDDSYVAHGQPGRRAAHIGSPVWRDVVRRRGRSSGRTKLDDLVRYGNSRRLNHKPSASSAGRRIDDATLDQTRGSAGRHVCPRHGVVRRCICGGRGTASARERRFTGRPDDRWLGDRAGRGPSGGSSVMEVPAKRASCWHPPVRVWPRLLSSRAARASFA